MKSSFGVVRRIVAQVSARPAELLSRSVPMNALASC